MQSYSKIPEGGFVDIDKLTLQFTWTVHGTRRAMMIFKIHVELQGTWKNQINPENE